MTAAAWPGERRIVRDRYRRSLIENIRWYRRGGSLPEFCCGGVVGKGVRSGVLNTVLNSVPNTVVSHEAIGGYWTLPLAEPVLDQSSGPSCLRLDVELFMPIALRRVNVPSALRQLVPIGADISGHP